MSTNRPADLPSYRQVQSSMPPFLKGEGIKIFQYIYLWNLWNKLYWWIHLPDVILELKTSLTQRRFDRSLKLTGSCPCTVTSEGHTWRTTPWSTSQASQYPCTITHSYLYFDNFSTDVSVLIYHQCINVMEHVFELYDINTERHGVWFWLHDSASLLFCEIIVIYNSTKFLIS